MAARRARQARAGGGALKRNKRALKAVHTRTNTKDGNAGARSALSTQYWAEIGDTLLVPSSAHALSLQHNGYFGLRQVLVTYLHFRALRLSRFVIDLPLYARFRLSDESVIRHDIHTFGLVPLLAGSLSCS